MSCSASSLRAVLGVLAGVGALAGCAKKETPPPLPPPAVSVIRVEPRTVALPVSYSGQTRGSLQVEVRARVGGILLARNYTEGRAVRAGASLFVIDPAPYRAALDKARGGLEVQLSSLARARADLARIEPLYAQNAVSRKDLDDATTGYAAALASVASARAEVEQASINLGYTRVTAPVAGLTSMEVPSVGSLVTSSGDGSKLTTIVRIDPLYVNFAFTDRELQKLRRERAAGTLRLQRERLQVVVHLGDGSEYPLSGRVDFTDNAVDAATGTIRARAVLPNPDGALLPGQFVRVELRGIERVAALLVPQRAVLTTPQGKQVWVLDSGDRAALRTIVGSDEVGGNLVVESGLSRGERVIIDGLPRLRPGLGVKPEAVALPLAAS
jgi:membrane fusion protein (multidrug efflux system)